MQKIMNKITNFIYNADESGLKQKSLPKRSLATKREIMACGYKMS
jgi:hypothetical protein